MNYIYVMIGGALGALCRYGIGQLLLGIRVCNMPIGTISVNLIGCFLLGLLTSALESRPLTLIFMVGFCGAFTTFSTFSSEIVRATETGMVWQSVAYTALSVSLGFLLFWWGKNLL